MLKIGPESENTDSKLSMPKSSDINPLDLSGGSLTAEDILSHVSPKDWERMICWKLLKEDPPYHEIVGPGGPGDYSVDVAAFRDEYKFSGKWEAYQGKRYKDPLGFWTVFGEIVKLVDGHRKRIFPNLPTKYVFVSPQGSGQTLQNSMNKPGGLKEEFKAKMKKEIDELDYKPGDEPSTAVSEGAGDKKPKPRSKTIAGKTYTKRQLEDIKAHAEKIKVFEKVSFESKDLTYILGGKAGDRYYISKHQTKLERASGPLRLEDTKQGLYIEKLVDVFKEQDKSCKDVASVEAHPEYCVEFQENRESFYSAEVLRKSVEDSVPPNTYDHLKEQIYMGVIPTARGTYKSGLKRLRKVHKKAYQMHLTGLDLIIPIMNPLDRLGICHQLANEDKLTWVK